MALILLLGVGAASFARLSPWLTTTKPMADAEAPTEAPEPRAEWKGSRIREYRRLGRTEAPQHHKLMLAALRAGDEPGLRLAVRTDVTQGLKLLAS